MKTGDGEHFPEGNKRGLFIALSYVLCACSALFTLLEFPLSFDIAIFGFVLALAGCAAVILSFRLLKDYVGAAPSVKLIVFYRKLIEYIPFIFLTAFVLSRAGKRNASFALDLTAVLLWLAIFIMRLLLSRMLSDRRLPSLFDYSCAARGKKNLLTSALEWIDALMQAVFTVLLINVFIFQLYEIPSESMTPTFMIHDRVFVFKTASSPQFPLSKARLPLLRSYNRGDIVVFRNPRYERTNQSEAKNFVSQLVYMLTVTKVNLTQNDENGGLKADPLVKRIVGTGGEKLVMVDGVLYAKKIGGDFEPVEEDASWAAWNLNELDDEDKALVKTFPLTQQRFNAMLQTEQERRSLDFSAAADEARSIAAEFETIHDRSEHSASPFAAPNLDALYMYQRSDETLRRMLLCEDGARWFRSFMTDWIDLYTESDDPYASACARLNILIKLNFGNLALRNARMIADGKTTAEIFLDQSRRSLLADAQRYLEYLSINDWRNMPIFPSGDEYIPDGHYFLMGDNRFNSLDLRHSYEYSQAALSPADPYSALYSSNMAPQYLSARDILGSAVFRFWPPSRAGLTK